MITMTKEQDIAILKKWKQNQDNKSLDAMRESAVPTIGCDGAIAVPWCGMWLCIETDGYCHT
ncbi:hypothetical protein CMI37_09005 [Candidatus Pacearchaeota archaeon]|nr:hypothetical protein [Candidatus Pacearchaeota archaeon]|tara:strand:+ start:169 stop:354 length:186 start_codon:yes stop_codon:yes gene_type:complete